MQALRAHFRRASSGRRIYTTCFGVLRGIGLFLVTFRLFHANGRRVAITIPDSRERLLLRLGTTDVEVFNSVFHRQEYEWHFPVAPRVIVDAGAYTGLSTAFFATRYPDAKIVAIEPDKCNFDMLIRNTACFSNVHPLRAALCAEGGFVSLEDPGLGAWGLRVKAPEDGRAAVRKALADLPGNVVRAITIPDVMREFGVERIDLLKLDIEGAEKEIFDNAHSWLDCVEAICLELHDRFRSGCSRAFFKAVDEFPTELRRGENLLVVRDQSRLSPLVASSGK